VRAAARACFLVCAAAGALAARPAGAAMTMQLRSGQGRTMTIYQDGRRVRVDIPPGPDEAAGDRLTAIVDLETSERFLIYDDVKAYFDLGKALASARAALDRAARKKVGRAKRVSASYRAMGENKTVNGYSCEMYRRVAGGRVEAEICFVLWGDAIGKKEDFEWFETFTERIAADVAGKRSLALVSRAREQEPGLAIWTSSFEEDGTRRLTEVVTLSRDPLQPALFRVPADYTEAQRPLTASERSTSGPPVADFAKASDDRGARSGVKISRLAAFLIIFVIAFGVTVHSVLLHIAASIALDRPRFLQAVIATVILWIVGGILWLVPLPPILSAPVGALATFVGVKISYGTSVPRTLALFCVSALIALMMSFAGKLFG
jgi:hypothetical protein